MAPQSAQRYLTALLATDAAAPSTPGPGPGPAHKPTTTDTAPTPTPASAIPASARTSSDSPENATRPQPPADQPATTSRPDDDHTPTSQPAGSRTPRPATELDKVRTVPDLRPPGLLLAAEEAASLARLGPLLSTPRAAKKLVNLYRLVRITIADDQLSAFTADGNYRVVQILLAVLVGAPTQSAAIFTAIRDADPAQQLSTVLDTACTADPLRNDLDRILTDLHTEQPSWAGTIHDFQPWCPRLARYSASHPQTVS
jgi:hypothetical protein